MKTNVRIERIVLDGVTLSRRERDTLGPAIARELRRLADEPDRRRAESQHPGAGSPVDGIARQIAAAVHQATGAARPAAPGARRGRG